MYCSRDARWINDGDATLQITQAGGAMLSQPLPRATDGVQFRTFAGVGVIQASQGDNRCALRVNGGTKSTTIETCDFQIAQFDSWEEAVNWFNSGNCLG